MRILLIEDHPIVRSGCRRLLQGRAETEVIEASTGADGLDLCDTANPDIIVLDLNLPDMSGFVLLQRILARKPDASVVVFSMYEDPTFVARTLEAGARGYIAKSDNPDALLEAIEKVAKGEIYLGAAVARKLALMNVRAAGGRLKGLSPREIDVMKLLGQGKSVTEIAGHLDASYRTAANIVAQLRAKLEVSSTAALIKLALESLPHPG